MTQRDTNFAEPAMDDHDEDGVVVENANLNSLMQVSEAEVNRQILTARAYPRNTTGFRQALTELVCYDEATALSCLYALKKGGAPVQGASIRFAEAAFQTWGNARCGSRIVDIGQEWITAQGFFWDLEKNTGLAFEVIRRLTDSKGKRYSEDVIMSTGNAASSIALRNAILKGIPKTAWNPIYLKCRQLSVGGGESISEKRDKMLKAFAPMNIDKGQVLGLIGVKGLDDVTIDHMIFMAGVLNAIKLGETTVDEAFAGVLPGGAVAPKPPARSDFERGTNKDTGEQKPAGAKADAKAEEKPKEEAGQKPAGDTVQGAGEKTVVAEEPAQTANTAFEDWYKDEVGEVAKCTKVRDVADLRDRVMPQLEGYADKEKEFTDLCDARTKEILDATKKPRR